MGGEGFDGGGGKDVPISSDTGDTTSSHDPSNASNNPNVSALHEAERRTLTEATRRSLNTSVGAHRVVGPQPSAADREAELEPGTVTRNERFRRNSLQSSGNTGTSTLGHGSTTIGSAMVTTGTPSSPGAAGSSFSRAGGADAAAAGGAGAAAHEELGAAVAAIAAVGMDFSSLPANNDANAAPSHPDIEYLAEARLVEEGESQYDSYSPSEVTYSEASASASASASRSEWSRTQEQTLQSTSTSAGMDTATAMNTISNADEGDPTNRHPQHPEGIASPSTVASDARPTSAVLEAPVAPASSIDHDGSANTTGHSHRNGNSNGIDSGIGNSLNREATSQRTMPSSDLNQDVCVAEPLKDSLVLPRRSTFLICGGIMTVILVVSLGLGLGLGLGLTRSSSSSSESESELQQGQEGDAETLLLANLQSMDDITIVANSPDPICFSLLPLMTNVSAACSDPTTLPRGGPLNQLVADGILAAVREFDEMVDVSLINAGSLRGDIGAGPVTAGTIQRDILPFAQDRAVVFSTTPAGIKAALEEAVQENKLWLGLSEEESIEQQQQFFPNVRPLIVSWPFEASYPYAGGLRYDVDLTAPNGQRVTNIEMRTKTLPAAAENLRGSFTGEWKELDVTDASTPIRVVASAFLESGGDGYFPGGSSSHTDRVVLDVGVTDLFLLYASKQETLIGPSIDEMSTRDFVPITGWV